MKKFLHNMAAPAALSVFCAALALLALEAGPLATVEDRTVDLRMRHRQPDPDFGRNIKLVLIDEEAINKYPFRSPVPRNLVADIVQVVDRAGARLIALDVFLKDLTIEADDQRLADTIRKSGKVVLVTTRRWIDGKWKLDSPDRKFVDASRGVALADLRQDPVDQRVRRVQSCYEVEGTSVPSLSVFLWGIIDNGCRPDTDSFLINYQTPPSTFAGGTNAITAYPASAVLALKDNFPKEWFENSVVIVGGSFEEARDEYRTPFYGGAFNYVLTPGAEIHANALATLLSARKLKPVGIAESAVIVLLALILLAIVEHFFKTVPALLAAILGSIAWMVCALLVFEKTNTILPVLPVLLGLAAQFAGLTIFRVFTEGRQKKWIRNAFQMYLSPEYVNLLLKNPDRLFLGGEERQLTILFTDIKGFTTVSEALQPQELVKLLNEYFNGMTEIIVRRGGTLDKYQGDSVMAFWGAPLEQADQAERALWAGIEMARFSEALSRRFEREGKPAFTTRIGINTGRVIVGNIGSKQRFNYTIIGDAVNLASRLEGANKQYGTRFMASEASVQLAGSFFRTRELDLLRVKGKGQPVRVFEVMGLSAEPLDENARKMLDAYNNGMKAYKAREWAAALRFFEEAARVAPADEPSSLYAGRCREFLKEPPAHDWDGVCTLKEK